MKFVKTSLLFFATALLFFSCAPKITNLQLLSSQESALRTRGNYQSYLALEYLTFSRKLLSVNDKKTSEYFAQKGRAVAMGQMAIPENPIRWKADGSQIESMVLMQKRLESVLAAPQIKFHLPIQTAHLTYLYDCWIARESTAIFRADELGQCRVRFTKLIDEIENYIDDLQKDKTPKIVVKEPEFERFEILFDFNLAKFNSSDNRDFVAVLKHLKNLNGNYRILLVGNADRVGLELYNEGLALQRAVTVKNYLIKNGVPENFIEMRSIGEDFPDIITKNGEQNQLNRSVGIYILKGYGNFSAYPLPLLENIVYREEVKKARSERGLKDNMQ